MARGPIKHTCPDIDSVQQSISSAVKELDGLDHILEELRDSNDTLRIWGSEQEDRADNLESQLDSVTAELDAANNTITELEQTIRDLESES